VALVLAAAAVILSAAAASGPLFVSAASDATLAGQLSKGCQQGMALSSNALDLFHGFASGPDPLANQMFDLRSTVRTAAVEGLPNLQPPVRDVYAMHIHVTSPGGTGPGAYVTAMSRTDALKNVEIVAGSPTNTDGSTDGVWLADTTADAVHAKVGDEVVFGDAVPGVAGATVTPTKLRVAGIFHDLQKTVAGPYWCDDLGVIYAFGNSPRFPLAFVNLPTAAQLGGALQLDLTDKTSWGINRQGLDVDEAVRLDEQLTAAARQLPTAMAAEREKATRAYAASHPDFADNPLIARQAGDTTVTRFTLATQRAHFVSDVLPSTVLPITIAAIVVALLLVGGSASFWFERRRREVDVLLAHGVPPWALGIKAVFESSIPVIVGAVGGYFLGTLLVAALGPSSVISARAVRQGIVFSAVATVIGFLAIGLVATMRCARRERLSVPHKSWLMRVPWDVAVPGIAAGVVAVTAATGASVNSTQGGAVARIDPVVLVVPLLAFVAATALVGRLTILGLRRLRGRGERLPNVSWLAWRRITGMPGAAALLLGAVALPTAIGIYGATVNTSVHRTLDDQNHLLIGADLVVDLAKQAPIPAALQGHTSLVLRRDHPTLNDVLVSVIGVDPDTFAKNVFWDDAMPGPSIRTLVSKLHDDGPGKPLLGIFSGGAPQQSTLHFVEGDSDVDVPVNVIATPAHIPGEQGGYPVLLVNRTALERFSVHGDYEFWIRGDPDSAIAAIDAAGIPYVHEKAADDVTDGSYVQPVSYTFSFLDALVTLAATVAAGALLLYLDARARSRRLSFVLTRRMGLSRLSHLGSIVIELAATMAVGIAVGVALAVIAAFSLRSRFSVDPGIPPSAIIGWPLIAVVIDVIVVLVVLALASVAAHSASERAKPAEVLREA
jgi:putative ABC transport system permease protein